MVDNVDRNTIAGVMFLSVHLDTVTTSDNTSESIANAPTAPAVDDDVLVAGDQLTIETNDGFVRFNTSVTILSQSDTEIIIVVPYDVNTLEITTKDGSGNLVTETKEVA